MSSPSWKAAMVQFLYRCWIFSNFLLLVTNLGTADAAASLDCHKIPPEMPYSKWKDCAFKIDENVIGHATSFVMLDFSNVPQDDINAFFAKATVPTLLMAAIKIVGNQNLETLNFENVSEWKIDEGSSMTTELFVKQKEKSEWYTATLKQLEATPKNLDLVQKFAGQLVRLKSNMDDIYEMNKLIGNGKDGEKISLGKTAKGDDVIEIVHKNEPKIELGLFCTANQLVGSTAPSSNWPADPFFDKCTCEKPDTNKFLVHNLKDHRERITQLMTQPKKTKKSAPPPTPGASASPAAASAEGGDDTKKNGPKKYEDFVASEIPETARPPTHKPTTQPPSPPPRPGRRLRMA